MFTEIVCKYKPISISAWYEEDVNMIPTNNLKYNFFTINKESKIFLDFLKELDENILEKIQDNSTTVSFEKEILVYTFLDLDIFISIIKKGIFDKRAEQKEIFRNLLIHFKEWRKEEINLIAIEGIRK